MCGGGGGGGGEVDNGGNFLICKTGFNTAVI